MTGRLVAWKWPESEPASPDYSLRVNGEPVFVHQARVRVPIWKREGLWSHHFPTPDGPRTAFAVFDFDGPVEVAIRPARPFTSARFSPIRHAPREHSVKDGEIRFVWDAPAPLTLLLDDDDDRPLHLFASAPEVRVPGPGDPGVLYFGPGEHRVTGLELKDGQTLYLAGGAVVRAFPAPDAKKEYSEKFKIDFYHGSVIRAADASGIRISGRGILDTSGIPHPGLPTVSLERCRDAGVEGIVLRDAANWNITLLDCDRVLVENMRIVSGRLNSDGINACHCRDVAVRNCFVRNHDDSFVVKSLDPNAECRDILYENCVAWNDWGYAFGVTYETRGPIRDIRFENCDVLSARFFYLGVRACDRGPVERVRFRGVNVENMALHRRAFAGDALYDPQPGFANVAVAQEIWSDGSGQAGEVNGVEFDGIHLSGDVSVPASALAGYDDGHRVRNVGFRNITLNGRPVESLSEMGVRVGEFVDGITFGP